MRLRVLPTLLVVAILLGFFAPGAAAAGAPARRAGVSPAGLLNPDGTLRLDGGYRGALDLSGWRVRLDPRRGPVFGPAVATGQWASLGSGGAALNGDVYAIAVTGTTVYVGGSFVDVDSLGPGASGLVKWDGSHWSALAANRQVSGGVYALALRGASVFAGGDFSVLDAQGHTLPALANLAEWNGSSWSAVGGGGRRWPACG